MRYLRLLRIFYRYSLLRELEYRVNFITNVFMSLFWLAWAILSLTIFFQHSDKIGDWTYNQVLIVVALYTLFNGIMEAFFRPNVSAILEQVRDGTFDFVLVKPVNAQFLGSLRSVVYWRLFDVAAGLVVIVYALKQLGITPAPGQVAAFGVMLASAIVIMYALWLMMVTLSFWFIKMDNLAELFYAFYETARFPITVYRGWVRAFLTFVIPIAFVTTVPASVLLGRAETDLVPWGIVLAAGLFIASNRFWNFALRSYSSASS